MPVVEISHDPYRAGIDPMIGGSLAYWRQDAIGQDFLRPARTGEEDPLQFGCFPLVPYSNRIRAGRFEFAGRDIRLPLNFGDHPHSIHGHGWQNAWEVAHQDAGELRLQYRHDADAWPFPYLAEQIFRLDDAGLRIDLRVRNLGQGPMPCGLGLHPYFPATPETRIEAQVDGVWLTDDEAMPTAWSTPPETWALSRGCLVGEMACDNLFTGWDGSARIVWPERNLGLTLEANDTLGYLVVYAPKGADFFCAEPVSHCTDAFNSDGGGAVTLQAGRELVASVRLRPYSL